MRTDERIVADEIDVIGDQHQISRRPERVHPSAGVGHHECLGTEGVHDANGKGDLLEGITLRTGETVPAWRRPAAAQASENQATGVSLDG